MSDYEGAGSGGSSEGQTGDTPGLIRCNAA